MHTVFIDGEQGTTGLRIAERLKARSDIELLTLPPERRKDLDARLTLAREADATFLCLPDDAARELVASLREDEGVILDASTAHRTDKRFAYGFPELSDKHAQAVAQRNRIAVPGCHASGAITILYPLVKAGILPEDCPVSIMSLTGYSGGGKKMIAQYEAPNRDKGLDSPRLYALTQSHKHLPEIVRVCGLTQAPIFQPVVGDYYSGMLVSVPLFPSLLNGAHTPESLTHVYEEAYGGKPLMRVLPVNASETALSSNAMSGLDMMEVFLTGSSERMIACARFDNLGKGASGAAIECMNIHFGLPPQTGLCLEQGA